MSHALTDEAPARIRRARRGATAALAAALLALALPAQSRHNVLVLVADDLGVDIVGAYHEGSNPPPTPNIDSLAARGVLFRNAWANPSCSPTRASLQTGRFPFRHTVGRWIAYPNNVDPIGTLQPEEVTLPELLDAAGTGYAHALIGKWHINDITEGLWTPNVRGGWSHFIGHLWGQIPSYYSWPQVTGGVETTSTNYVTTQQVDDALAWIGARTGPWVCYLCFTAPHLPFDVPPAHLHTWPTGTRTDNYKAIIQALDTELGRLFTGLGSELQNTDILFLGDNGSVQNTAEPPFDGSRAKGTPYEGGLNVPLLVAGPSVTAGGREVTALACAVDVFATVAELTGADAAMPSWVDVDGVSLVPYLRNPAQASLRRYAFAEEFIGDTWPAPNTNGHACVRDDRYKLIHRYSGGGDEMFDLVADPFERVNLLSRGLSSAEQIAWAGLLNELSRLRGRAARIATLGAPRCTGSNGTPAIGAARVPRIGGNYDVLLTNAASAAPAALLLGLSATQWGGRPLPLDLSALGAGVGCTLWCSPDNAIAAATSPAGDASTTVVLPYRPELVGRPLFHTWLCVDPGAPGNVLGVTTSDGIAAVIGH
ncbi:MAG: sulfatase-like hydrolase/transferase [Planctomycetes bacterium]|nr:sulfatase-like hydrolase/transferase [Planctomycetota bacterium]